jgi:thiamine transporter
MFQKIFDFLVTAGEEGSYKPTPAGNIVLFVVVVLLFIAMAAFSGNKKKTRVKQLAFSAMAVTLTVVTSFIRLPSLPFGGSITLFSMFFICLIGYLYGTKAGIITGIAYGLINLILEPQIYYPVQVLLDYPIAFGSLGLAGVFLNTKYSILKGYLFGVFGRYVCHVISGYVFFAAYAPKGMNPMLYSLGYNATYIAPEALATVILLLLPPVQNALKQVKKMALQN